VARIASEGGEDGEWRKWGEGGDSPRYNCRYKEWERHRLELSDAIVIYIQTS